MAADEIELKFLCERQDVPALLAAAPAGADETRQMVAIYYDTPDGRLRDARISLRLRESGGKRVQTLKRGDGFAREEHEAKVTGEGLDLTMPAVKAALKPAHRKTLEPAFTVTVTRQLRTFRHEGAQIELALDQGVITADARRRELCELELELKGGDPAALFALARKLSAVAPLYLSFEGKAAQGQALRAGTLADPRRHEGVKLARGGAAAQAFQTIARNELAQIAANALILREADGEEALHQLRVALRRLRSAMSTFKSVIGDAQGLTAELKWLSAACDEARDLDVFAHDNAQIGGQAQALAPQIEAARAQAHAKACAAVASQRFRDLVLETAAWAETGAWLGEEKAKGSAREFSVKALDRRWRKVLRLGQDVRDLDDEARHELRIAAKKLRYAAEAFAPLFAARPGQTFIGRVKRLQDTLGTLNDAAVAAGLIERLHPQGEDLAAARQLLEAREALRPAALKTAGKEMAKLEKTTPFWR